MRKVCLALTLALFLVLGGTTSLVQGQSTIPGNGPAVHGSVPWNEASYGGRGIKVGIIDGGFEGTSALLGSELPTSVVVRCYTDLGMWTSRLVDCEERGNHGTAVAESLVDVAPDVSLYLAHLPTLSKADAKAAVDWMLGEGVSIINLSLSWPWDGPGDGTSPFSISPLNTVDWAVEGGATLVNASSNAAESTFSTRVPSFVSFHDDPDRFYMEFTPGTETTAGDILNDIYLQAGDPVRVQLRWDDRWGGSNQDLDILVLRRDDRSPIAPQQGQDYQAGRPGDIPFEFLEFTAPTTGFYGISVAGWRLSRGLDWVQLMVYSGVSGIEYPTGFGSITNPGESRNPGMLTVGAAPWYDTQTVALYSGRGATVDGRIKPEVVGADCGITSSRAEFCGTSQATPHVAGVAALVQQRYSGEISFGFAGNVDPHSVADYIKQTARQRALPHPNNTWGYGFATLPTPAPTPGTHLNGRALRARRGGRHVGSTGRRADGAQPLHFLGYALCPSRRFNRRGFVL